MPPPLVLTGKPPVGPLDGAVVGERPALAPLAEAVALERERDQRAERVVELRDLHVGRADVGVAPTSAGPRSTRGRAAGRR